MGRQAEIPLKKTAEMMPLVREYANGIPEKCLSDRLQAIPILGSRSKKLAFQLRRRQRKFL